METLIHLRRVRNKRDRDWDRANVKLAELIEQARAEGHGWREIAKEMDLTRQGVDLFRKADGKRSPATRRRVGKRGAPPTDHAEIRRREALEQRQKAATAELRARKRAASLG